MISRKLALTRAIQDRTCPPGRIREDLKHRDRWRRHRESRPFCEPHPEPREAPWIKMTRLLGAALTTEESTDGPPTPGEVRPVAADRCGWRADRYINPPLLLVLAVDGDRIQAAPISLDPTLAAPGDLIVPGDKADGVTLVVEVWNRCAVPADWLEPPLEALASEVVEAARRMAIEPGWRPGWALKPWPMEPDDPRHRFRELERDVVSAVAGLMVGHLRFGPPGPPDGVIFDLPALVPGVRWITPPRTAGEALALARPPEDRLPLAAADGELPVIASLFRTRWGRTQSFTPVQVEIQMRRPADEGLGIAGRFVDLPTPLVGACELLAYLADESNDPVAADHVDWEPGDTRFFIRFPVESIGNRRLNMAVICDDTHC